MAPAVVDMCSRGCSPRRRMSHDPMLRLASRATAAATSMRMNWSSDEVTSPMGTATTTVRSLLAAAVTSTRHWPDPVTDPVVK